MFHAAIATATRNDRKDFYISRSARKVFLFTRQAKDFISRSARSVNRCERRVNSFFIAASATFNFYRGERGVIIRCGLCVKKLINIKPNTGFETLDCRKASLGRINYIIHRNNCIPTFLNGIN